MTPTERVMLSQQLERHEGLRLKVYYDTLNIPTIGIGRNLKDVGISKATAYQMLAEDIDACLSDLATFPWFADLDAVRQIAICDLRFNVGPTRFRGFVKLQAALARKDYATAAAELLDSRWARQVQPTRRDTLIRQIREGV
jgi:lysozyme